MGFVPPGTSAFDWLREQQRRTVQQTSGLQLTRIRPSDPNQICGRQIDSSVAVGGVGGIPIVTNTITPDLIQGHAFVAPTYVDAGNHGDLLINPTAIHGFAGWNILQVGVGQAAYTYDNNVLPGEFNIDYAGGAALDSLLTQTVDGLTPGATMTLSCLIAISHITSTNSFAGYDIFDLDANNNGTSAYGSVGGIRAMDYTHNAVQPFTLSSVTFTVPPSGNIQVRLHVRNNNTTDGIGAHYIGNTLHHLIRATKNEKAYAVTVKNGKILEKPLFFMLP